MKKSPKGHIFLSISSSFASSQRETDSGKSIVKLSSLKLQRVYRDLSREKLHRLSGLSQPTTRRMFIILSCQILRMNQYEQLMRDHSS